VSLGEDLRARQQEPSDIADYLLFIYQQAWQAATSRRRAVFAELGVRTGNSTCAFLAALEEASKGELWSVDIADPQVPLGWRGLPWWHLLTANDVSVEASSWLPPELDLLFIDTSHTYEHTLIELALYVPRVRRGGLVLLHDTQWEAPDVALPEPTGPVARALDAYCRETGLAWQNLPGKYGLGIIWL
jgi:predicted O-methyltransferase YrrM